MGSFFFLHEFKKIIFSAFINRSLDGKFGFEPLRTANGSSGDGTIAGAFPSRVYYRRWQLILHGVKPHLGKGASLPWGRSGPASPGFVRKDRALPNGLRSDSVNHGRQGRARGFRGRFDAATFPFHGHRPLLQGRHFPANLLLDDLAQRDVRGPQIGSVGHQGTADPSSTRAQLANAA